MNMLEYMILCRYHRNLTQNTLIFVGTVPLINYQTPTAPPAEDYSKLSEIGWTTSGIPVSSSDGPPPSNLYPTLRKNIFIYLS